MEDCSEKQRIDVNEIPVPDSDVVLDETEAEDLSPPLSESDVHTEENREVRVSRVSETSPVVKGLKNGIFSIVEKVEEGSDHVHCVGEKNMIDVNEIPVPDSDVIPHETEIEDLCKASRVSEASPVVEELENVVFSPVKKVEEGSDHVHCVVEEKEKSNDLELKDEEKGSLNKDNGSNIEGMSEENATGKPEEVRIKEENVIMDESVGGDEVKENGVVEHSEVKMVENGGGVTGNDVSEEIKVEKEEGGSNEGEEKLGEKTSLDEVDLMEIPSHWYPKACIRVTVSGGAVTEEELLSVFDGHGTVSSIAFENDKRDAAIVRLDSSPGEDMLVSRIQEKLQNSHLGDRTLRFEPFKTESLLFVGNLTPNIDDSELKNMFEPHGRVERAFVLRNSAGKSKCYGFVEYSLKSQAIAAKTSMNAVPMDGRLLRVEWSDCKSIKDIFSSVLFVDRITKQMVNVEDSLRTLFGQYGKVKDLYLAIGVNGVSRGFAFIDFFFSADADKAREALDGRDYGGLNLRISFASPGKSAQSYKQRLASQGPPSAFGATGRGAIPAMQSHISRGRMYMPYGGNHLIGAGRSGMPGMRLESQFIHGAPLGPRAHEQNAIGRGSDPFVSGAPRMGMMGQPPSLDSNVPPRQGMPVSGGYGPVPHFANNGSYSQLMNSGVNTQVTSQAKAYEDDGKIRSLDYYNQAHQHSSLDQSKQAQIQYPYHQSYQHLPQQSYQHQPQKQIQQQSYHPPQQTYQHQTQQSLAMHSQYQPPEQHSQYPARAPESYSSQPYQHQPSQQYAQSTGHYQQHGSTQEQSYSSNQQYSQQYNQSYGQTPAPEYSQPSGIPSIPNTAQQYQQVAMPTQPEPSYGQSTYAIQYAKGQNMEHIVQTTTPVAPVSISSTSYPPAAQGGMQPQALGSYYQQQQTAQVAVGGSQFTAPTAGTQSQGTEAQWAAYYANQAAYQQQTSNYSQTQQQQPLQTYPEQSLVSAATGSGGVAVDVGQKRTYDGMNVAAQQNPQTSYGSYPTTGYQQPSSYQSPAYQQTMPVSYSQPPASAYSQPPPASYQQPVLADGYYQQQQQHSQVYDYNKKPRY
ncbi:uncharacterized protein LOC143889412 isoform X2 [Tasmannia lanceolata]|uniref:uncharacterized protein LOC143889412 isoform X2 n=1 Tax=Tasmannia lanceolata TaxID=3420 RepID=UPI00406322F5